MTDNRWEEYGRVEELFMETDTGELVRVNSTPRSIELPSRNRMASMVAKYASGDMFSVLNGFGLSDVTEFMSLINNKPERELKDMAIFNPETNEMDYTDLNLLPSLSLKKKLFYSLISGEQAEIQFAYRALVPEDLTKIELVATLKLPSDGSSEYSIIKSQDEIDELFFHAINQQKTQYVDDCPSFINDINALISNFDNFHIIPRGRHEFKGIGYIIHKETKDIPFFFETVSYDTKTEGINHTDLITFHTPKIDHGVYEFFFYDKDNSRYYTENEKDRLVSIDKDEVDIKKAPFFSSFETFVERYLEDDLESLSNDEKKKYLYDNYIVELKKQHKNKAIVSTFSDIDFS